MVGTHSLAGGEDRLSAVATDFRSFPRDHLEGLVVGVETEIVGADSGTMVTSITFCGGGGFTDAAPPWGHRPCGNGREARQRHFLRDVGAGRRHSIGSSWFFLSG